MHKKIIVVYDTDAKYLSQLVLLLNKRAAFPMEAVGFDTEQLLYDYLDENSSAILLAIPDIIDGYKKNEDYQFIKLSDSVNEEDSVYKYGSISEITNKIMKIYCSKNKEELTYHGFKQSELITIFSKSDSNENLDKAMLIASEKNNSRVLFLPLITTPYMDSLYSEYNEDILDLIYYCKSEKGISNEQIQGMVVERNGIDVIPTNIASIDYSDITFEDWENILTQLMTRGNYDYIYVYASTNIIGFIRIMKMSAMNIIITNREEDNYYFNKALENKHIGRYVFY